MVIEPKYGEAWPFLEGVPEVALPGDCRETRDTEDRWRVTRTCIWSKIDETGKIIRWYIMIDNREFPDTLEPFPPPKKPLRSKI